MAPIHQIHRQILFLISQCFLEFTAFSGQKLHSVIFYNFQEPWRWLWLKSLFLKLILAAGGHHCTEMISPIVFSGLSSKARQLTIKCGHDIL